MSNATHTNSNEQLIKLAQSGDAKAFEILYTKFAPAVFGIIFKTINNLHQSEDILQNTFIQAWKSIHECEPAKQPVFTWFLCIARDLMKTNFSEQSKIQNATNNVSKDEVTNKNLLDLILFNGYNTKKASNELNIFESEVGKQLKKELEHYKKTKVK